MLSFLVTIAVAVPVSFLAGECTLAKITLFPDHNYMPFNTRVLHTVLQMLFLCLFIPRHKQAHGLTAITFPFKTNRQLNIQKFFQVLTEIQLMPNAA